MMRTFTRTAVMVGLLAAAGGLEWHRHPPGRSTTPQVIQSGFESTDELP